MANEIERQCNEMHFIKYHGYIEIGCRQQPDFLKLVVATGVQKRLAPEEFGQAAVMQHCANALEQCAIEPLRDAVVLGRVVDRKAPDRSRLLQMACELRAEVFAAAIRVQDLDVGVMLGAQHSLIRNIGVERLTLAAQQVDPP